MTRIWLHIGTHKTGSTSLQRFLSANRRALRARGCHYPTDGPFFHAREHSHSPLAHGLAGRRPTYIARGVIRPPGETVAALIADIRACGCPDVIVSSEHFSLSTTPAEVEAIRRSLAPVATEFRVIVYLRRQDKRLESGYNQRTKNGEFVGSFAEFVEGALARAPEPGTYERLLSAFGAIFGRQALVPRVYERARLRDADVVRDFLSIVGIEDGPDLVHPPVLNESVSDDVTALIQGLIATLDDAPDRRRLARIVRRLDPIARRTRHTLFTPELRERVLAFHAQSNARVAREYFGRSDGVLFEEAIDPGLPVYRGLPAQEQARLLANLILMQEREGRARQAA